MGKGGLFFLSQDEPPAANAFSGNPALGRQLADPLGGHLFEAGVFRNGKKLFRKRRQEAFVV